MLPGKSYAFDDYVRMAWKRKWWFLVPTVVIGAATYIWSARLPDRYYSETVVLIVPQTVPSAYVRTTITAGIAQRLTAIRQQLLSRTRLERLIEEFNLYEREREVMLMEDVVGLMRRHVTIEVPVVRRSRPDDPVSFTVGFEAGQPRTAMLIADRLASLLVQENIQDREVQVDSTNQFLQTQMEEARRRLLEHDEKLETFRRVNAGRLPTQAQSNFQLLQSTQVQIQANADAALRDREQLAQLEKDIEAAVSTPVPAAILAIDGGKLAPPGTIAQQLEGARAALTALELRLRPDHPDVGRARRQVADLEVKAEQEAREAAEAAASGTFGSRAPTREQLATLKRVSEMRAEVAQIQARLEQRKREEERLRRALGDYTTRLEAAPGLESELSELMRDYQTIQEQYTTLLRRSEESKMAVSLERRQVGEQFRVIDSARLPERPSSPNRVRINLMGLLGGLALGLAWAALLEYRDTTLKTDEDVVASLSLPVLAVIPAMLTSGDRQRRKRRRTLAIAGAVASVATLAALAWRFDVFAAWVS
jgi:polysaccharide chain length determinant protein (PEP-CTERM system associated)